MGGNMLFLAAIKFTSQKSKSLSWYENMKARFNIRRKICFSNKDFNFEGDLRQQNLYSCEIGRASCRERV